jgi:hypothetical protein
MHTQSVLDGGSIRSVTQKYRGSRLKGPQGAASRACGATEMLPHLAPACFAGPTSDVDGSRTGTMGEDISTKILRGSAIIKHTVAYDRIIFLAFFGGIMYFMLNFSFLFRVG